MNNEHRKPLGLLPQLTPAEACEEESMVRFYLRPPFLRSWVMGMFGESAPRTHADAVNSDRGYPTRLRCSPLPRFGARWQPRAADAWLWHSS